MNGALLDTSVLIGGPDVDLPESAAVSVVSIGEMWAGIARSTTQARRAARAARLRQVEMRFLALPVDLEVARCYGDLLALAREERRVTTATDLLIIATAAVVRRVLVTRNAAQGRLAERGGIRVHAA